jgi:hypothetical protein
VPHPHELLLRGIPGRHRREQPPHAAGLAEPAAAQVLVGRTVLVREHDRQRRHHRHDEAAAVVLRNRIGRQHDHRGGPCRPVGPGRRRKAVRERDLPRLPGLEIDRFGGHLGSVDHERSLHLPPRLTALVAEDGRERGGQLDVGHAVCDRERFDPGVVGLGHGDRHRLDVERRPAGAARADEQRLRLRRPGGDLLVADEQNPPVGQIDHPLGSLRGEIDRLRDGAGAVHQTDRVDRLDGVLRRAKRIEAVAAGRPAERKHARAAAGGEPPEGVLGAGLGVVEERRAPEPLPPHAHAVVDDEDRVDRTAAGGRARAEPQERTGHREAEEDDGGRPQQEQPEVAEPQQRPAPLRRLHEEVHRPPFDLAKPRLVQQVDDDRCGGRGHAGDGQRQCARGKGDHRGPPAHTAAAPRETPAAERFAAPSCAASTSPSWRIGR